MGNGRTAEDVGPYGGKRCKLYGATSGRPARRLIHRVARKARSDIDPLRDLRYSKGAIYADACDMPFGHVKNVGEGLAPPASKIKDKRKGKNVPRSFATLEDDNGTFFY